MLLGARIAACTVCREMPLGVPLPHEPRPVAVLSTSARIAICGQAPGTRVHASGRPFTDPSGDRLRTWMGVRASEFYDASRIAIVPMGFCFPGLDGSGGDLPPRKECAVTWRAEVFSAMPQIELVLLIGQYAQRWHLGAAAGRTLTDTVRAWRTHANGVGDAGKPIYFPMPHPSWRNNAWLKRNPWFEAEIVPALRAAVSARLG
ncbi:MAG: uracil-DNA glycosylase family protein [Pseudomonadota bacterium]